MQPPPWPGCSSCSTAATTSAAACACPAAPPPRRRSPVSLTLDEGKWNGRDTYCKWSGVPNGFGSQVQMDDGAQRIYRGGLSSAAAGLPAGSLLASHGLDKPQHLLWCLSATFTASAAFGGPGCMAAPSTSWPGGWPPAARPWPDGRARPSPEGGPASSLTDGDLFPPAMWAQRHQGIRRLVH